MKRKLKDISALRVFTLLAAAGVVLFVSTMYAPWPQIDFPQTVRVLTATYLAVLLCLLGLIGLYLTRRGEPLMLLSVNLLLSPCFFMCWFSAGGELLGQLAIVSYFCAVGFHSLDCFRLA